MVEANEMRVLRKIVGKTKIDRIRRQQIRESCGIQPIKEWVEGRRREWDERITIMNAAGRRPLGRPKRRWSDNHRLKQAKSPL